MTPMPIPSLIRRASLAPPARGREEAPAFSVVFSVVRRSCVSAPPAQGREEALPALDARICSRTAPPARGEAPPWRRTGFRIGPEGGGRAGVAAGGVIRAQAAGHLGEFLQGLLGPGGPVALVTLPAPVLRVAARLAPGPFGLHCAGPRALDRGRAAALCRAVTGRAPFGRLVLRAEMPAGGGAGSSTAALLAAARAWALACGRALPVPERLARLCLEIEGATDPLMHPEPARLLWASRLGRILVVLPPPPALEAVGGFLGAGKPTDPGDADFADVSDLAAAWAPAAARGDAEALGRIATESARRNQLRRGGPDLAPLLAAAARHGAVGIVAAHTGAARGLLFAPGRGEPDRAAETLRGLGLTGVRRFGLAGPAEAR